MKSIQDMNKDELFEHAKSLGLSLDRRKSIVNLREEVERVAKKPKVEVKAVEVKTSTVKRFRHKIHGRIMPYNPAYADNPNLEPYYGD